MKPKNVDFKMSLDVLYDIVNLGLSFYCNSTELRFIEELHFRAQKGMILLESEIMLGISMQIMY